jgi:hypothetical protein
MTSESFTQLRTGMSLAEVEELVGKPWELRPLPRQGAQAIYCERMAWDGQCREERRYILLFQEGRLVSKQVQVSSKASQGGSFRY